MICSISIYVSYLYCQHRVNKCSMLFSIESYIIEVMHLLSLDISTLYYYIEIMFYILI